MNYYQNNPFRILGLWPNASAKEILSRANEIKVKSSVGIDVSFDFDFAWMGPVDRSEENINNAVQRLENPIFRFQEEGSWFWCETDLDKEAINLLRAGDKQGANNCWKVDNVSAKHNRLILAHSVVVGLESSIIYESSERVSRCVNCKFVTSEKYIFCIQCGGQLLNVPKAGFKKLSETHWKNWDFVLDQILSLNESGQYWTEIHNKAIKISDARLNEQTVKEVHQKFVGNLLKVNFYLIKNALDFKDIERVKCHSMLLSKRSLPVDVLKLGFNDILRTRIDQIQNHTKKYSKIISNDERTTKQELYSLSNELTADTAEALYESNLIDVNFISEIALAKDQLAKAIRELAITLNNEPFNDYEHAIKLIKKALNLASTDYVKQGFQRDKEVFEKNLLFKSTEGIQEEIVAPIMKDFENGEADRALATLNERINSNDTSADAKNVLIEMKISLEKRLAKHGKPIKSTPSLETTNGFGAAIYGDILYFVVFFIPIVPIRKYSLEHLPNKSYRFFGELELPIWMKCWQWIVAIGVSIWILTAN